MRVQKRHVGEVCILDFRGSLLIKEGGEELRNAVVALLHDGRKKLVLNLAGVAHMDSAGLGDIVWCYSTVERQGGSLKIAHLTKGIRNILAITKLVTVFETYDDEEAAVASFGVEPAEAAVRP